MKKMKLNIQLFGGSVAIQTITETTDIDTNQSTFTIPAKMTTTGETHNYSNASMTMQWRYEGAESWTSLNKQTFSINKSSKVTKNWTLTLTHNDDGSLSNVQFRVSWYITDSTKGTTGATTFTPTYIPRKSDIQSITSGTTDYAPVLTWTPASASFKYIIRYLYGSWTYQTGWITPNSTAQQTFNSYTITGSSIAPYMTSSTTAQVLASLYTYTSDGHLVGDSNVYFNVTLNGNIVPSVSFSNVSEAGDVPSSWGIYVKNKSRVALSLSASGIYGSAISSYRISYYGGAVTTASTTTSYLTQSGSTTFTGQVTDTRGRSASTTTTINVVDYSNPTISTAQVQRCDANGNIENNGEYLYISYGGSISSCNGKNISVYKVGYRVHETGSYTYIQLASNVNSYSASGMLFTDGIKSASASGTKVQFSSSNTYDIQFYVADYFTSYANVQTLDTGFDLMNFNPSGKSMAIGKVSEAGANEELFEVGMNTKIDGNLNITQNVAQIQHNGTNFVGNLADGRTIIGANNGTIYIRPKGYNDATKGLMLTPEGNMIYDGAVLSKNNCAYWTNQSITWTANWSWQKMIWSGVSYNNTGIFIDGNEFYIPSGISIVKVSISASYYNIDVPGDKNIAVFKNGAYQTQLAYVSYSNANPYVYVSGFAYVAVTTYDHLSIYINSGQTGTMRFFESTNILIEPIA